MQPLKLFLFLALVFSACNNADTSKGDVRSVKAETGGDDVRNDISIKAQGLTVEQAFLMFEDGKLVPADNKVEVGQQVNMRLIIKGWEAVNGKVFIGASEKISTDDGQVVLDEADLFASYATTGIDVADAGAVTLSAVITRIDKLFKYFEVSFRVWDKNSKDNITGSYRLYLK